MLPPPRPRRCPHRTHTLPALPARRPLAALPPLSAWSHFRPHSLEEMEAVEELYERAVGDFLSVQIWADYLEVAPAHPPAHPGRARCLPPQRPRPTAVRRRLRVASAQSA